MGQGGGEVWRLCESRGERENECLCKEYNMVGRGEGVLKSLVLGRGEWKEGGVGSREILHEGGDHVMGIKGRKNK